jgi:hypothetical protein
VCDPGILDESIKDAGLVGLSFLRAHAGLLDKRYGFFVDPRVRHPQDWALGLNPLETPMAGSSVGAAITGAPWHTMSVKEVPTHS